MKTTAIKFNGTQLYKDDFELPCIKPDEILAKVICDTLCLSTYKAYVQGKNHVRIPDDVFEKPIILGHEFCGEIIDVGAKWSSYFNPGEKFIIQPAINYNNSPYAPGYSYPNIGGAATYVIIPNEVMEKGCLIKYDSESPFFAGSLAEPLSCIVGGFKKMIHVDDEDPYKYNNGIKPNGNMVILGGAGPMGIATISYTINCETRPKKLVVVDRVKDNLDLAMNIIPSCKAKEKGVELHYVLSDDETIYDNLMQLSDGQGYNDVFVYAAVKTLIELGDSILAHDGCLNLFAGPYDKNFKSEVNFYNIHYKSTHMVGLSGGTTTDMEEYVRLVKQEKIDPSALITHIGGLNSVIDAIPNLPNIPGGKKLIYTHFDFPLTSISKLNELSESYPVFNKIVEIVANNNGLWTKEAEDYLLENS